LPPQYAVEIAESGQEALEVIQDCINKGYAVPLVITDYIMPSMRGDELLKEIGIISPDTYGILLTGQADLEGVRNSIRNARLQSFILKPWDTIDLAGDIQKTLNIYNQEQQIKQQNELLEQRVYEKTEELLLKNAQLEELNREKDNLLSIVAHDLSTPLNNIFGLLNLIEDEAILREEHFEYLRLIYSEIEKGKKRIENLLAICKYDNVTKKLDFMEVRLHAYLQNVALLFKPVAHKKDIDIHLDAIPNALKLYVDEELFMRILQNLLSNAIKFSLPSTNIHLGAYQEGSAIYVYVKDEGLGFSEDDKTKIFQKFQKLSARPTAGESSTGLGLSIAKSFTERLGGKILLQSEQGKGSTFTLVFPALRS
jgi:signal transduction histidine kinase